MSVIFFFWGIGESLDWTYIFCSCWQWQSWERWSGI